jgi:hypothetical protein
LLVINKVDFLLPKIESSLRQSKQNKNLGSQLMFLASLDGAHRQMIHNFKKKKSAFKFVYCKKF